MDSAIIIAKLQKYIGEDRIAHTVGVYESARWLGSILLPERLEELSVAALLHDIAKELSKEELLDLIRSSTGDLTEEDLATAPALHSFAGAVLAQRDFSEYVNDDILSAIYNHTLGTAEMSLFDKIIFISDYIEEGRRAKECKAVRDYLALALENDDRNNIKSLDMAIVMSIEFTEEYIREKGFRMNSRSVKFKNSILEKYK